MLLRVVRFADITPSPLIGTLLPAIEVNKEHNSTVAGEICVNTARVVLKIVARGLKNDFYAGSDEQSVVPAAVEVDG